MPASALRAGSAPISACGVRKNGLAAAAPKPAFKMTQTGRLPCRTMASASSRVTRTTPRAGCAGQAIGKGPRALGPILVGEGDLDLRATLARSREEKPEEDGHYQWPTEGKEEVAAAPGKQTEVVRREGQDRAHRHDDTRTVASGGWRRTRTIDHALGGDDAHRTLRMRFGS